MDEDIVLTSIMQLWYFQFLLFFIDAFTSVNIKMFMMFDFYILMANIILFLSAFFQKISKDKLKLFFGMSFSFFALGFLSSLSSHEFFNQYFWLVNAISLFTFTLLNYYKKDILHSKIVKNLYQFLKRMSNPFFKYGFLFLLFLVTLLNIDFDFLNNIFIFSQFQNFLIDQQMFLTVLTILFGLVTFWQNKNVISDIEDERREEEKREKKRAKEFDEKYNKFKPNY